MGATFIEKDFPFDFHEMMLLNGKIIAAEAYAIHQGYVKDMSLEIGPWVRARVLSGEVVSAAEYIRSLNAHQQAGRRQLAQGAIDGHA